MKSLGELGTGTHQNQHRPQCLKSTHQSHQRR